MKLSNLRLLQHNDTIKFVVGSVDDLLKAKLIIEEFSITKVCNIHFSPIFGQISLDEIVNFIIKNRLNGIRLQPQLHKIVWDPNMRGV